ncbi:hypothetical protein ACWGQ5_36900 [Streptomyces sp. NPDC055722]
MAWSAILADPIVSTFLFTWLMRLVIRPLITILAIAGLLLFVDCGVFGGQISTGLLVVWSNDR